MGRTLTLVLLLKSSRLTSENCYPPRLAGIQEEPSASTTMCLLGSHIALEPSEPFWMVASHGEDVSRKTPPNP